MKKQLKPIPRFSSEADERAFWERNHSIDYVDWSKAKLVTFPKLRPSTETISLRMPEARTLTPSDANSNWSSTWECRPITWPWRKPHAPAAISAMRRPF